ncbi:hypothetical protein PsorP6_005269 [Peronosclerospora sorghi]|uniref:Uncharacterized protein n=1 Tax=Peronosclerospora sorghi TaxID=230839 RepID=A0ACC0W1P9_9STRA|nr:hypothetical protein PsorP6_005269 [Peronosclerospora sorghi]
MRKDVHWSAYTLALVVPGERRNRIVSVNLDAAEPQFAVLRENLRAVGRLGAQASIRDGELRGGGLCVVVGSCLCAE